MKSNISVTVKTRFDSAGICDVEKNDELKTLETAESVLNDMAKYFEA